MINFKIKSRISKLALSLFAALIAILILFSRRGATILQPQVWSEDGYIVIPQFYKYGWESIFIPVQGYLITIPRLISNATLTIAPVDYPFISTLMAWMLTASFAAFIVYFPSMLRGRFLLALSCFFIPTDPENFGTHLYTFWWAGLILIILSFWENKESLIKIRLILLLVCGLSTPIVALTTPIMALRAYFYRSRSDILLFSVSFFVACIQLYFIYSSNTNATSPIISLQAINMIVDKFFGLYIIGENYQANEYISFFGLLVIASIALVLKISNTPTSYILVYYLGGAILLSVARTQIDILDPVTTGPRYFFYPFILISWLLIQGIYLSIKKPLRLIFFVTILIASFVNALTSGWSRTHDDIKFKKHLNSCAHFEEYSMPIQTTGSLSNVWRVDYMKVICIKMSDMKNLNSEPFLNLFPFETLTLNEDNLKENNKLANNAKIIFNDLKGKNFSKITPLNFEVIGSYIKSDNDTGRVSISMKKGESIIFSSGPGGKNQIFIVINIKKLKI
jgi:hypothetical protein